MEKRSRMIARNGSLGVLIDTENSSTKRGIEASARLSGAFVKKDRKWLDAKGRPEVWYSYGDSSNVDKKGLEDAMKDWSDATCIKFSKMADGACKNTGSPQHGMINVDTFMSKCCFSDMGNLFHEKGGNKKCQQICIDKQACNSRRIAGLVADSLGLLHPTNRPDRDKYIVIHHENLPMFMMPPIERRFINDWLALQKCERNLVDMTLPVPFDFRSVNQLATTFQASTGSPAVFVARNRSLQWVLDSNTQWCQTLSHYDKYQVNMLYGCDKKRAMQCSHSGKTTPKCLNYGFLKTDCTCACPPLYYGHTCETYKPWKANHCAGFYCTAEVSSPTVVNVSDCTKDLAPPTKNDPNRSPFRHFAMIVTMTEPKKHVYVVLKHESMEQVITKLQPKQEDFIANIDVNDCRRGLVMYWGRSKHDHMRTECFSTVGLNDLAPLMFRNRVPREVDFTLHAYIGQVVDDPHLNWDMILFKLDVGVFDVMKGTFDNKDGGDAGGPGGNGTDAAGASAARSSTTSVPVIAGALALGFLLLAIIGLVVFWLRCHSDDEETSSSSEGQESASDGSGGEEDSDDSGSDDDDHD